MFLWLLSLNQRLSTSLNARSQNICPVHLIRARVCGARKNFFAKRRMRAGRCGLGQTGPTLGVGGNLLCEIAQYGLSEFVRVGHASRVLVSASRRNVLFVMP